MNLLPPSTFRLPQVFGLFLVNGLVAIALAEPSLDEIAPSQTRLLMSQSEPTTVSSSALDNLAPSQTRLILAQANPGAAAAVSSQAVATQPEVPQRAEEAKPPQPAVPAAPPPPPPEKPRVLDSRLDLDRPRNSQLSVSSEQTLTCGEVSVTLPAGTYEQKLIVENPEGKRAIGGTSLKPQQVGLGYIRYLSDVPLKVGGFDRSGGLDVPIRPEDKLPVRIWYKKMTEPDDLTKAFTFILPPVGLIAGLGAWSSGNILIPDTPPTFTEARDYFLRKDLAPPAKPAKGPNLTPTPAQRKSSGLRTP